MKQEDLARCSVAVCNTFLMLYEVKGQEKVEFGKYHGILLD